MKGKMTNQAKNADCSHQTHLFRLPRSSRLPFDETVVTINSVSLTIISTSSAIVTGCERSISIPSAIKAVNNSIFSATETINRATSPMIFLLQRTIPLPDTIVDATPTIIGGSQITAPEVQIIIYVTKTIISREPQIPANQGVPGGSHEIIISQPETIISVLQIRISNRKATISELIVVIDGL